jgi:hypothetical protein
MQFSKNNIYFFRKFGGDERARTADPLRARQVLSQLSYTPIKRQESRSKRQEIHPLVSVFLRLSCNLHESGKAFLVPFLFLASCILFLALVGLSGVEPLTSRLSGVRSNQLSYRPQRANF